MCGRYTLTSDLSDILTTFAINKEDVLFEYSQRYNIAPSQTVAVISNQEGKRKLEGYRWGLVPHWAKDIKIGYSMINARAESLSTKPAFRNLLSRNRVAILSDGFYEWKLQEDGGKQPYRFQLKSRGIYGFAGLYDEWKTPEGELLKSCTIITTRPNDLVRDVHDRMPVILDSDTLDKWINPDLTDREQVLSMLIPYPTDSMISYPVSKNVGNVKNSDPSLINPIQLNSK